MQGAAHRLPVRHGAADVCQNRFEAGGEGGAFGRVGLAADRDLHPRFPQPGGRRFKVGHPAAGVARDLQHRMDRKAHLATAFVDRRGHRIDQKRHVVIDDLDDGMRRGPAVRFAVRVVGAHLGGAGRPDLGKAP
jgi:hypothetical protein